MNLELIFNKVIVRNHKWFCKTVRTIKILWKEHFEDKESIDYNRIAGFHIKTEEIWDEERRRPGADRHDSVHGIYRLIKNAL